MYIPLLKCHSGLRWLLLLSFILTLIYLFRHVSQTNGQSKTRFLALTTLIITHLQFILGLALYFISPKVIFSASSMSDKVHRFFLVEHISLMVIAIALVTIGYSKWKRSTTLQRNKQLLRYYLIAFLIILISIPWPFRIAGSNWF